MKVLVTGAKGQLGCDVIKRLDALGIAHKGIGREHCDLTDRTHTLRVIGNYAPDAVIHCAAYTAVDKAESEEALCRKINVDGSANVADACKKIGAKMMYISTDYVFDGQGDQPFEVDAPIAPINVYGQSKAGGEAAVRERLENFFIVRISWVFGANGNNFVKTMLRLGQEKESINVVGDQIGSPTSTADLSALLCNMIQTEKFGTYHATNEGHCSWAEFAQLIMDKAGLHCKVRPISTSDYPTPAQRPLNSRLSKKSLDEAGFKRLRGWGDAVIFHMS